MTDSPEEALLGPRLWLRRLLPLLTRLGFPAPDPHWERTAQVNWGCHTPPFGVRFLCLYLGHDLRERLLREEAAPSHCLVCDRCGWEGPWTR